MRMRTQNACVSDPAKRMRERTRDLQNSMLQEKGLLKNQGWLNQATSTYVQAATVIPASLRSTGREVAGSFCFGAALVVTLRCPKFIEAPNSKHGLTEMTE